MYWPCDTLGLKTNCRHRASQIERFRLLFPSFWSLRFRDTLLTIFCDTLGELKTKKTKMKETIFQPHDGFYVISHLLVRLYFDLCTCQCFAPGWGGWVGGQPPGALRFSGFQMSIFPPLGLHSSQINI